MQMDRPTRWTWSSIAAAMLAVLVVPPGAVAGGPEPGSRRDVLGQCGNGQACVANADEWNGRCGDVEGGTLPNNACECSREHCTMAAAGAFTGQLTISITEDCPGGQPGGHTSMRLVGQTQDGVPFDAAPLAPFDFCDVDIATACFLPHNSPFFCSNVAVVAGNRLTEAMLPGADWLLLHPLPASLARIVRGAAGSSSAAPVIVRAETCGPVEPAPGGGVQRTYCVKGHLIHPGVPLADCDPGKQTTCIASSPLPAVEGTVRASTVGTGIGRFTGTCEDDPPSTAPELLFDWTPGISGRARLSTAGFTTNFDPVLYVRQGACHTQNPSVVADLACDYASYEDDYTCSNTSPLAVLTLPVTEGEQYCVVVDGSYSPAGNFDLSVDFCCTGANCSCPSPPPPPPGCGAGDLPVTVVQPAVAPAPVPPTPCPASCCRPLCGDGERDPGEECDDGNTAAGDGCNAVCHRESTYRCPVPASTCGGAECLYGHDFFDVASCCPPGDTCVQPNGDECVSDFFTTCCRDAAGRECCRDEFGDTVDCVAPDGATCSTEALGLRCAATPGQCSECRDPAGSECGLGRMLCLKSSARAGSYCAAGSSQPGATCVQETDCGGIPGTTTFCRSVGFARGTMTVNDQFHAHDDFDATAAAELCIPAGERLPGELPESAVDPATALRVYRGKVSTSTPRARLRVTDEFFSNGVMVDLRKTEAVLIPSSIATGGPPDALDYDAHGLDGYRCTSVALAKKFCARIPDHVIGPTGLQRLCNHDDECGVDGSEGPCIKRQLFPKARAVTITSRAGTRALGASKLTRLCLPTSIDDGDVRDDLLALACYKVKNAKTLCAATPSLCASTPAQSLFTANDYASEWVTTGKPQELCVPARVNRYQ